MNWIRNRKYLITYAWPHDLSDILKRAIDEYWERHEKREKGK
jgi:hypothetical protein